jgi:hypothetical protein
MNFYLFNFSWLAQLDEGHCEVDERVSHGIHLAALQVFDQLDGLQGSNAACGGRQGWHDPACLQLHADPLHFLQFVVASSQIGHRVDDVDVAVVVLVLLELFRL